jgi:hypothetical protein
VRVSKIKELLGREKANKNSKVLIENEDIHGIA